MNLDLQCCTSNLTSSGDLSAVETQSRGETGGRERAPPEQAAAIGDVAPVEDRQRVASRGAASVFPGHSPPRQTDDSAPPRPRPASWRR